LNREQFAPDCALATRFFTEHTPNGTCRGCSAALSGRRTVWCSTRCSKRWWTVFAREHDWNDARKAALKRDRKQCTICGSDGLAPAHLHAELLDAEKRTGAAVIAIRRKAAHERTRGERAAALRARAEAIAARNALERRYRLEVDHIIPRVGGGYATGCWNHLSNLRTLCHTHHVAITNRQRDARKAHLSAQAELVGRCPSTAQRGRSAQDDR